MQVGSIVCPSKEKQVFLQRTIRIFGWAFLLVSVQVYFAGCGVKAPKHTSLKEDFLRHDGYYFFDNGSKNFVPLDDRGKDVLKAAIKQIDGIRDTISLEKYAPAHDCVPAGVIPTRGSPFFQYLYFPNDSVAVTVVGRCRTQQFHKRAIESLQKASNFSFQSNKSGNSSTAIKIDQHPNKTISFTLARSSLGSLVSTGFILRDSLVLIELNQIWPADQEGFIERKSFKFYRMDAAPDGFSRQ